MFVREFNSSSEEYDWSAENSPAHYHEFTVASFDTEVLVDVNGEEHTGAVEY